jgi:hypothetical protein
MILRILIGIIAAIVIFWLGVRAGELHSRAYVHFGGYGRMNPMMMRGYGAGGGMMGGGFGGGAGAVPPTPANSAATSTAR